MKKGTEEQNRRTEDHKDRIIEEQNNNVTEE